VRQVGYFQEFVTNKYNVCVSM